ncbi:FitA-like ribbon-helix-helix domain-containing protein [Aphanothece sacrum]|uniref:Plasmid stabilization protein n=1 Tax=Aphanothece sacrum FPU1 TaxID=1920663 RepID=A0A401IJF0_APHSA|nr:plasmid stability protein [Aphanothece sacrum]GBF81422.1 plasmid stabilization protein [Aphanothece sacrum FPU1]GBF85387.1 plasmid stabilization protein [Aphanothece sacrum FPU3]
MINLTIHNLDENLKSRLQKQAKQNGHTLEEEAKEILRLALMKNENPINLVTLIERRFAHCEDIEIPEIPREPIRQIATFLKSGFNIV